MLNTRFYPSGIIPDPVSEEGIKELIDVIPPTVMSLALAITRLPPVEREAISALVHSREGGVKQDEGKEGLRTSFFEQPEPEDAAPFLVSASGQKKEKGHEKSVEKATPGGRRRSNGKQEHG